MADLINAVWKGTNKADKKSFGTLDRGTVLAGAGNDIISIDQAQGGLVDLGAGNDILNLPAFFSSGSNQLVTTIDGGTGIDTVNLTSFVTLGMVWNYESGVGWHLIDDTNTELALLKNVERIGFADGVKASLGAGVITMTGTKGDDTIWASSNNSTDVVVQGGAGNDEIEFEFNYSDVHHTLSVLDGGAGTDQLTIARAAGQFRFVNSNGTWFVQTGADNSWKYVAELAGIEKLQFDSGVTGSLGTNGVALRAGNGGALLNGTSGADTMTGGAGSDTFRSFAGNDVIDLRAGGSDLLQFEDSEYVLPRTQVTIIGRKQDDTIEVTNDYYKIISDTRKFDASGVQVGDLVLGWANNATTVFHFTAK